MREFNEAYFKEPKEEVNSKTKEKFFTHQLSFKKENKFIFGLKLTSQKPEKMNIKNSVEEEKKFAIFGEFCISIKNNLYIKLKKILIYKLKVIYPI